MKNEKMKRVAALALAGTIAVSTISPAAFADEGEPVEQNNGGSEEQQQAKTQADGAIDHVVWDKPTTEDDESKKTTGHVNPSMSENDGSDPGFTLETDGDVIKTEETDGNTTTVTVETPEDEPLTEEIVTPVPEEPEEGEEPLTDEEQAVVEEAEEVEDGIEGALTEPVEEGEPENTNDKVEGALEDELEEKEEDQDLAGAQEEAIEGALNVDGDTGKGSVTVDGEKFDAEIMGTTESKPQTTTPTTGNDGNHAEEDKKKNDITNETTTIVTTTIKLTPDKLTQTKEGEEPAFTNTELSELLEMEIPEDAEWDVDSEGHRTLTLDGKTITLTQEESSLETGTGWIATITSTIKQGKGEAEIKDTVDVIDGSLHPTLDSWCEDPGLDENDIKDALNKDTVIIDGVTYTVEKVEGTEDNYFKDTYTLTTTDENGKYVSYTIEKQPVITEENLTNILKKWGIDVSHTVTADALKDMDQNQLQEVLGSAYTKGDNGEIYYTYQDAEGNDVTQEVTFERDATIGQYVAITVTKTNEHGKESAEQGGGWDVWNETKDEAYENAQLDALKDALVGEAKISEEGEFVKQDDGSLVYKVDDKEYPVTQGQNGQWSVDVAGEDGTSKTYTFTIKDDLLRPTTTTSSDTTDVDGKKEQVAGANGLEADDIKSVTTTTVTDYAYVASGTLNWTDTETITGILGLTLPEGTQLKYDSDAGNFKAITVETVEGGKKVTKVYTFTTANLTDAELAQWKNELLQGQTDNPTLGSTDDLKKVTWTVTTTTELNETKEPVTDGDNITVGDPNEERVHVDSPYFPKKEVTFVTVEGWDDEELDLVKGKDGKYYEYDEESAPTLIGWQEYIEVKDDEDDDAYYTIDKNQPLTAANEDDKSTLADLLLENTKEYGSYTDVAFDGNKATLKDSSGNLLEVQYTATQTTVTKNEKDDIDDMDDVRDVVKAIKDGEYTVEGYDKTGDDVTEESFKRWLYGQNSNRQAQQSEVQTLGYCPDKGPNGGNGGHGGHDNWEYTITKVTSKSSTKLEMTVLSKKEIDNSPCNNGITGRYEVNHEQKLDVKNCWGVPEYNGEGSASYDTYTEWLTTTDTFVAGGVQYGEVTTSEWKWDCGDFLPDLDVEKKDVAPVGFDYQEVTTEVKVTDKVDIAERVIDLEATIETLDNGSGSGSGTGTGTGEGDGDGSFVAEDLPLTDLAPVMMTIAETETPLAAAPAVEEETDIEDEDVALAGVPDTGDKLVDLADAQVAKSAVPKTGDESGIFLLLSAVSGMALAVLSFIDRKGRHSRFGSQH